MGYTLVGGLIEEVSLSSIEACKKLCEDTDDCTAFTYFARDEKQCVTRKDGHADETKNAITTSARMSCFEGNINSKCKIENL